MEQWSYYGANWLAQQQQEQQEIHHRVTELMGEHEDLMNESKMPDENILEGIESAIDDGLGELLSAGLDKSTKSDPLSAFEDDDLDF